MDARNPFPWSGLPAPYPSPRWALALVVGAWTAQHATHVTPTLAALLAAAALAASPAVRGWMLPLALGLLVALPRVSDADRLDGRIDEERPVVVVGRVAGPVHGPRDARRLWLDVDLIAQRHGARGPETTPTRIDLLVTLPTTDGESTTTRPPLEVGARLRLRGRLGRLRASGNPGVAPDGPWTLRLESLRFLEVVERPGRIGRWSATMRGRLEARLEASDKRHGSALARALALGDASWLPERWRQGLRASGAVHVLSVSGLHVGLVAIALWALATVLAVPVSRRSTTGRPSARRRRVARTILCLAGIELYLLIVGPRPSVLRATAMAAAALVALLLARPPIALHGLSLAAIGLVVTRPTWVDDLGFQLSVAATLALLVVAPRLARGLARVLPRWMAAALSATTAAQLATAPLLVRLGGGLHPSTPLLDLVLVPWLALSLAVSLLWAVGALLGHDGSWLLGLLELATRPLEWLAEAPASRWRRLALVSLSPLAALGLAGGLVSTSPEPPPELVALDVGQGDALLLRDGPRAVLIDGGGWRRGDIASRILVPSLDALGVHALDAVVLTHPDRDHCDGLVALGHVVPVDEVWASPGWREPCAAEVVGRRDRAWRPLWRGVNRRVGRWALEVLWPPAGDRRLESNDRSLVLRATAGRTSVLLTGDIEASTERALLVLDRANGASRLRADVLKVAHHGSKSSTTERFLNAVRPTWALVTAGRRNRYGHPHPDVVRRLERAGAHVLRTDRDGQIVLRAGRPEPE